jgi:single-stranded DNA-binding protein
MFCANHLHKGDPIYVAGRLSQDSWEDKQMGKERTKTKVTAYKVECLLWPERGGGPREMATYDAQEPPQDRLPDEEDIPF